MPNRFKYAFVVAVSSLAMAAGSAQADIVFVPASSGQGTLVHGTGVETTDYDVVANLGAGGPNIVHFTGDTTQTNSTSDLLRLQQGQGQADITGAEITLGGTPNDAWDMLAGDIFLTGHAGMDYLEFALTSGAVGTVDFLLTDNLGGTWAFNNIAIGNGDTHYAFDTLGLQSITNLHWSVDDPPGAITILKQVRLDLATPGGIPEPATWGLMILGLGAIGGVMRRQRRSVRYNFA